MSTSQLLAASPRLQCSDMVVSDPILNSFPRISLKFLPPSNRSFLLTPSRHAPRPLISAADWQSRKSKNCSRDANAVRIKAAPPSRRSSVVAGAGDGAEAVTVTGEPPAVAPPPPSPVKQESDVRVVTLTDDTVTLRGRSSERLKFEIEYGLKQGTTENSYLIRAPDKVALVDVPDRAFSDAFVKALAEQVDLGSLYAVVLGHFSPKRADTLLALANARPAGVPRLRLYCSSPAARTLDESVADGTLEKLFDVTVVRLDEVLDLGAGHKLRFILTPTPRWPDGLCTYDPATQLLYTNKLFSAHVCAEDDLDVGGWDTYGEHWQFFYDCMLAPVARQAEIALNNLPLVAQFSRPSYEGKVGIDIVKADLGTLWNAVLSALKLDIGRAASLARVAGEGGTNAIVTAALCPLHGPVVRSSLTELVREYKKWTVLKRQQAAEATVAVIFASAYGNTSALAQAISRGVLKAGVGVETLNCEQSSTEEVITVLKKSSGFVIGSPTLGGHMPTPVQETLGAILQESDARSKPCGVFGSFGWSGEAVDEIEQRLKDGGFQFAFPAIRCKFKPTEAMLQVCEESGTDLAQVIKKQKQREIKQQGGASQGASSSATSAEQAVGRVVGSLCVVSARSGDAESAMLASWVSQASFTPPGLTLAVAKERAVEGILLQGGTFVLNVLGQDKAAAVSKQLLKPFGPGAPRFGDLAVKPASNGATILEDAIAYLECTVQSRMEAGDHYVLYATVTGGELQNDKVLTAVHYRKTGARY